MGKSEYAIDSFNRGLNCCQSVLSVFSENLGLDKQTALKIASGFGGGMCQGNVCGAVTGAIMVLNLKYGNSKPEDGEAKEKTYHVIREFSKKFEDMNGSIMCNDLLGIDLKHEENRTIARQKGLFKEKCPKCVEDAINILETIL
ncbi:C_GCAxxG_C_C family protein [Clostridium fermenticellae]|uniref:C_GCAxxG_C_C family protein n=1 Tax=Clostridium fermenticellae TaxID=2068654 RepID=A0A386H1L2_9CLOT|nr:C-GCAxxG-C-C family protein [Clostridium fermenticellae]AYD39560.1 C_GCAxxG_C_C family protein [Clostridium fermenticellae]